jgi:hypothetical protein
MRKFILITAMVLVSAAAQAAEPRGLALASNEDPLAATPARSVEPRPADAKPVDVKPAENQPVETPKFVDRPAAVGAKPQQSADQCPCAAPVTADAPKTVKPKRRHESTEARVIYELHRHGIYW